MDLSSYRTQFPISAEHTYLNHAAIAPYSTRVAEAIQQHLAQMQSEPFERHMEDFMALIEGFKQRIATLIGAARSDEIVAMANTALGINSAAYSLPLRPGDNVLVLDGDYPTNIYPWLNLAPRGILVKWVPQQAGGLDLERLEARIDRHTRVIALSSVMFATGFKNDLQAVGELCRQRGIYFVVDGIQSLGAFPLDVQACHIDMLACGSHKWLMGAAGSGFLYCRHELLDDLQPGAYVGAAGVVDAFNFLDYNFTLQPSADRFSLGTPNIAGMIGLHAAVGLLQEVGSAAIAERITTLTTTLTDDLQARGYRIVSNLAPEHRSSIVIVEVPDAEAARAKLLDAGVVVSVRGTGLRVSPHFYNNEDDVLRVGAILGQQ